MAPELREYFLLGSYVRFVRKLFVPPNSVIDPLARPVSFDDLENLQGVEISRFEIDRAAYEGWVRGYFPTWKRQFGHLWHKKLIEFFTTYSILDPQEDDQFMDAGGGGDTYLQSLPCAGKYLQDLAIPTDVEARLGNAVHYVESNAGVIPLPDCSLSRISCHHAFEHFQEDADSLFVTEVQRLLKHGGRCCIIPVFIADHYVEVTNRITLEKKFDERSNLVIDPTAAIPGSEHSGNYARIYDLKAFQERIVSSIDLRTYAVAIRELRLDGEAVPDLRLRCHRSVTAVNRPYRALVIERTG